jgi:hypothetical protein
MHNKSIKVVRFAHWTAPIGAASHYRAVLVRCALRAPLCRLARRYAFATS